MPRNKGISTIQAIKCWTVEIPFFYLGNKSPLCSAGVENTDILFEKENINTMDAKGEVLLTIMASLAQQESQSLSQNVKLGLQFRYQAGKVQVNHNRFLGYTKDDEGSLVIAPEEAEIVLRIYREYLEGASLFQIGQGLEADGIKTAAGSDC